MLPLGNAVVVDMPDEKLPFTTCACGRDHALETSTVSAMAPSQAVCRTERATGFGHKIWRLT